AQARHDRHDAPELHPDDQRLQHHLRDDAGRARQRDPGVRHLLLPGGVRPAPVGPRRDDLDLPGAAPGHRDRPDQPVSPAGSPLRHPGRDSAPSLLLFLSLIPPALLFIPLYRVLAELAATDPLGALFLSYPAFTVPFCTWLLIGFFKALPDELEEAALIDGAS